MEFCCVNESTRYSEAIWANVQKPSKISMLLQVMNTTWLKRESRDTGVEVNGQRVLQPCESFSDFSHSWVVLLLERETCDF